MQVIIASRRRGYIFLLSQFHRLLKLERSRHSANVESAQPLSADLRARIRVNLESVYGPGLETGFEQEPELIGGTRIQIGSDVYDGSVRSRLAALETSFGIVHAEREL
jgi:F-type H+-transporting ATPase subunit delta